MIWYISIGVIPAFLMLSEYRKIRGDQYRPEFAPIQFIFYTAFWLPIVLYMIFNKTR